MSDKNSTPGADPSPPSGASAAKGGKVSKGASAAKGGKVSKAAPAAAGDKVSKAAPAAAGDKVSKAAPATPADKDAKAAPATPADKDAKAAPATPGDKDAKAAPATPGALGLPDLQAHAEAPTWLSGGEEHDAQIWSGAFEIEADSQAGGDAGKDAAAQNDADKDAHAEGGAGKEAAQNDADKEAAQNDADTAPADDEGKEAAESELPAEPEVTNPDDVTLETPVLATPEVGSEAAEAASLDETAAEVKAVEAEAADAAVLTDPAANRPADRPVKDPADKDIPAADESEPVAEAEPAAESKQADETEAVAEPNQADQADQAEPAGPEAGGAKAVDHTPVVDHTQGIAAAAPMTGEHPAAGSDLEGKSAAPESTDESPAPEASGKTAPAPGSRRALRTAENPVVAGNGKGGNKRLLLIIGGIAVAVVLAVVLFLVLGNSEKDPGVLEEDVAPIELETGACLSGFAGVNEPTTVVTCETPHNAQLVATATYPEDDEFPGADALSQRANEVCASVRYTEAATQNADLGLQISKAVPTPESWNDGDRRVDCFVVAGEGQELTESLIEQ